LRQPGEAYSGHFHIENEALNVENTLPWERIGEVPATERGPTPRTATDQLADGTWVPMATVHLSAMTGALLASWMAVRAKGY
jgi:hypothetical protein